MVEPMPPSMDPPELPWTVAGGGALFTAQQQRKALDTCQTEIEARRNQMMNR